MLLGLIKVILLWWIIVTVMKWYRRIRSGNDRKHDDNLGAESGKHPEYQGNIVDAEFEDIDEKERSST